MESGSKRGISTEQAELLRQIPSVDELLAQPRLKTLAGRVDRGLLVEVIRTALADLRTRIAGDRNVTVNALESRSLEEHIANAVERILSRGELIEIGDGFRIPEIMAESGAALREVGTTNRTRVADYENAIGDKARLLLRVHPSNFTITGFAEKPSLEELVGLSRRSGLPLVEDLGSGCLVELSESGISEPVVRQSIDAGVSIVTFSGDKLLGGPQAGIIAGKREQVTRVRRHPLFRALRVDKLTIAALEATLGAYLRAAWDEIPAHRMIRTSAEEIKRRAENFLGELRPELPPDQIEAEIIDGTSLAGGGATPTQSLPTQLILITSARHSAAKLEERLRRPPAGISVIARVEEDRLVLEPRTVFSKKEPLLVKALAPALH